MIRRLLLATAALAMLGAAPAQDLTADAILENLRTRAETLVDVSVLITGRLVDPDGTEIALEIETEAIPDASTARAYFLQPDALADNFVVLSGQTVYNYIYLTNQVTVLDASDPDALGGLLPIGEGGGVELTFDLDELFDGWEVAVIGWEDGVYRLRFDNSELDATIAYALATIPETSWLPTGLTLVQEGEVVLAELRFEDYRLDQGLDPADVSYIPEDAEVIDERN